MTATTTLGTTLTCTLAALASSNNASLGIAGIGNGGGITQGSGYTEINEAVTAGPNDLTIELEWRADGQTTVDWSFALSRAAGIAIEVVAFNTLFDMPHVQQPLLLPRRIIASGMGPGYNQT